MFHLDTDEYTLHTARVHWVVFFVNILGALILAALPIILYLLFRTQIDIAVSEAADTFLLFILVLWIGLMWMFYFFRWTDYYLDIWIITNERIIDIEQQGPFARRVSTLRYNSIQDITIHTRGFFQTLLHVADIHIQTAGAEKEFIMRNIQEPDRVKDIITSAHQKILEK